MKIGIVGGYGHESVRHYPGAQLAWACDGYDERASLRAKEFNSSSVAFASMDQMLAEFQPDLVYVGTVYARSGLLAAAALEMGFPVVSEKPLAADSVTLERLRALGSPRLVAEFTMRWTAPFELARSLVAGGEIGESILIEGQKSYKFGGDRPAFYKERALFGGIIPWVATHAIDYAAWCTGLEYRSVSARHGNRHFPEYAGMEDHAAMMFEMSNGAPCLITADFLRPATAASHGDNRLRITGSAGLVEVRNSDVILTNSAGVREWSCATTEAHHRKRAQDLVDAALGIAQPVITSAECLHITEAALAARTAADSLSTVAISPA